MKLNIDDTFNVELPADENKEDAEEYKQEFTKKDDSPEEESKPVKRVKSSRKPESSQKLGASLKSELSKKVKPDPEV